MKSLNSNLTQDIFTVFALSNEEMLNVRGGDLDGDPIVKTTIPPIII